MFSAQLVLSRAVLVRQLILGIGVLVVPAIPVSSQTPNAEDLAAALNIAAADLVGSSVDAPALANGSTVEVTNAHGTGGLIPLAGPTMVRMSTGKARDEDDSGYVAPDPGTDFMTSGTHPYGTLVAGGCPEPPDNSAFDRTTVTLQLVVPPGRTRFSFKFRYLSADYPEFTCSLNGDAFVAWLTSSAFTGNIALTENDRAVTSLTANFVVNGFDPLLNGTGLQFGVGAATNWLTATAPAVPGSVISLQFSIWDNGDGIVDSLVLIDDFRWLGGQLPTASAGPDQLLHTCQTCTALAALSSFGSSDPEGTSLTFSWSIDGVIVSTKANPIVPLPLGTYSFSLIVTDGDGAFAIDTALVEVRDIMTIVGTPGTPGPQGPAGPPGPPGPQGPAGADASVPPGTIVLLAADAPPPSGYTFIGTTNLGIRTTGGHGVQQVALNVYRKN